MTIAACYLSSEGVVFGADSTTTMFVQNPQPNAGGAEHHYNYAQKVFQIGRDSNLGITMWGLGNLPATSYRTLIARFADDLEITVPTSVHEAAVRWCDFFWLEYSSELSEVFRQTELLESIANRTPEQQNELDFLHRSFSGGFCIGGCCLPDRTPHAFEYLYSPGSNGKGQPEPLSTGDARFWGCPNLVQRLIVGVDYGILADIENSGKWNGTTEELIDLILPHRLAQPFDLPIREAIDWIHASISTTIQAMKFSHLAPVCGGAIELSVITTDRPFRWVRHKRLDAALGRGSTTDA